MSFSANFPPVRAARERILQVPGELSHQTVNERFNNESSLPQRKRLWGGDTEFNIQMTRIATARELLQESMLAYTQRMSKRSRKLYQQSVSSGKKDIDDASLLIRATHISRQLQVGHGTDSSHGLSEIKTRHSGTVSTILSGGARTRSLPNMKLEPLLGNKEKYKLNLTNAADLKDILGLRHIASNRLDPVIVSISSDSSKFSKSSSGSNDDPEKRDKIDRQKLAGESMYSEPIGESAIGSHDSADVDVPRGRVQYLIKVNVETASTESKDEAAMDTSFEPTPDQPPDYGTFVVVGKDQPHGKLKNALGGRRSKKVKRMKILQPNLSSIPEDDQEDTTLGGEMRNVDSARRPSLRRIPLPHIMDAIGELDAAYEGTLGAKIETVEERKKDAAMLRRVNSLESPLQTRQKSMASHAKRKLRKLPPLEDGD